MTDLQWLKDLRDAIWKPITYSHGGGCGHGPKHQTSYTETRKLTEPEWGTLCPIMRSGNFLVNPSTSQYGFTHAVAIFDIPDAVGFMPPHADFILVVVAGQLPWAEWGRQAPINAWATFKEYTHTPRQAELREFLGMADTRMDKGYYEY